MKQTVYTDTAPPWNSQLSAKKEERTCSVLYNNLCKNVQEAVVHKVFHTLSNPGLSRAGTPVWIARPTPV